MADLLAIAASALAQIEDESSNTPDLLHSRIKLRRASDKVADLDVPDVARKHLGSADHRPSHSCELQASGRAVSIPDPQVAVVRLALKQVGDRGRESLGVAQRVELTAIEFALKNFGDTPGDRLVQISFAQQG
ncbi:MAG TPA: hypothetical protein VI485_07240 [Vicinamibacterales bacterium]|nr:hypothetical protein [Vicinamibacterales bacterium]